jgi:hypothetical protein
MREFAQHISPVTDWGGGAPWATDKMDAGKQHSFCARTDFVRHLSGDRPRTIDN